MWNKSLIFFIQSCWILSSILGKHSLRLSSISVRYFVLSPVSLEKPALKKYVKVKSSFKAASESWGYSGINSI